MHNLIVYQDLNCDKIHSEIVKIFQVSYYRYISVTIYNFTWFSYHHSIWLLVWPFFFFTEFIDNILITFSTSALYREFLLVSASRCFIFHCFSKRFKPLFGIWNKKVGWESFKCIRGISYWYERWSSNNKHAQSLNLPAVKKSTVLSYFKPKEVKRGLQAQQEAYKDAVIQIILSYRLCMLNLILCSIFNFFFKFWQLTPLKQISDTVQYFHYVHVL